MVWPVWCRSAAVVASALCDPLRQRAQGQALLHFSCLDQLYALAFAKITFRESRRHIDDDLAASLVLAGVAKIGYDLPLWREMRSVKPPEKR